MGETTSDFMVHRFNPYFAVAAGGIGFAIAMSLQFSARRYMTWVYWLAVVMVSVFGTMAADVTHIVFGVPYVASTAAFLVVLASIFYTWDATERTLSIHSIYASPRVLLPGNGAGHVRAGVRPGQRGTDRTDHRSCRLSCRDRQGRGGRVRPGQQGRQAPGAAEAARVLEADHARGPAPVDRRDHRLRPDPVCVPLGDLEQRLDQRFRQQVRLKAQLD